MKVSKIFIVLITVVACVVLGAFALNILMPNVTLSMVNTVEDMIHSATGIAVDFNGDTRKGGQATTSGVQQQVGTNDKASTGVGVGGFTGGTTTTPKP